MTTDKQDKEIKDLQDEIKKFKEEIEPKKAVSKPKKSGMTFVFNIFADILGGVITAFILNHIYSHFFGKNALVFAILLLLCTTAGLYNAIRLNSKLQLN